MILKGLKKGLFSLGDGFPDAPDWLVLAGLDLQNGTLRLEYPYCCTSPT